MATQYQSGGFQGVIPFPPQQQAQQMQPTGQQMQAQPQTQQYGLDSLPPPPQQPGQAQQPTFGMQQGWPQQTQGLQPQGQPQQNQQGGWPQQPQQQFQQQVPQQQPQGGFQQQMQQGLQGGQLNMNTRLDGPGVPQELRGRTVGEALGIYSALANDWMGRQSQQRTPAQQSLQQMQPQQQGSAVQAQPQQIPWQQRVQPQQQMGGSASLWTNPEETIGAIVKQQLEPMLAPMVQQSQQQALAQAHNIASTSVVDFRSLEPEIMQMLTGADPAQLANPNTWIGAADIIRGRQMREGRYQAPMQGQQQVQIPGRQTQGNPAMMNSQPAQQFQQVPAYGFFTEQPSAPNISQFGVSGQPNAADADAAKKFGMPIGEYMAWKYGVQQNQQGAFQQVGGFQQQMGGFR